MPHSFYLGGPYRWTPGDRAKVEAWTRLELTRCPRCRTRPCDWMDENGELLTPPLYEAVFDRCHGCNRIEVLQVAFKHSLPKDEFAAAQESAGVTVRLDRFDPDRVMFITERIEEVDFGPTLADPLANVPMMEVPVLDPPRQDTPRRDDPPK